MPTSPRRSPKEPSEIVRADVGIGPYNRFHMGFAGHTNPIFTKERSIAMALFHANEDNFKELVLDSKEPVLVDFWATWCGPCQMLAPVLEELSQQVKVVKVDVDENPQLAMAFQVSSIPTVISFRDGKGLKKSVGVVSKEALLELLK